MKMKKVAALSISTTILLALCCSNVVLLVRSDPNLSITSQGCDDGTYDTTKDPYKLSVDYVLNDLLTVTPNTPGFNRVTRSPYLGIPVAYGHATCTSTLTPAECVTCIQLAFSLNSVNCNGRVGGHANIADCTMVFNNSPV